MPRRVRAWVGIARRSWCSKRTAPLRVFRIPMMLFMRVVLPAPLRPMRPAIVPVGSERETSRRICTESMETLSLATSSTVHPSDHVALHFRIGERDARGRVGNDAAVVEREDAFG